MLVISGCTASKGTVIPSADLGKYRYVSVLDNESYHIPAELMEYMMDLFDAVEKSGLEFVGDMNINKLSADQQSALLLAKCSVTSDEDASVVTVNFVDFASGRPVASCKGVGVGVDRSFAIRIAINNVGEQISRTFGRK